MLGPLPISTRKIYTHSMSRREEMPSDKLIVSWKKLYLFVGKVNVTFYVRLEHYEDLLFYQSQSQLTCFSLFNVSTNL